MINIDSLTAEKVKALLPKILQIDEGNFEQKLVEQPSTYTLFATLHAEAIKSETESDILLENYIAEKKVQVREQGSSSQKRMTADAVEAIISSDDKVQALKTNCCDATYKVNLLKGVLKGLDHQKDCLIQVSANKRKEKDLYT